ncbi:hypothetical protein RJ639_045096 [Escallonia herrerae]|uniref:Uncharacterized protein n=1 Tax=Escallonia herrerae TaxID=1293975 RepID=A0AA88W869_9ASTE|nr:hypothetical protein RJ639_045096 [Escallonia herrerae]
MDEVPGSLGTSASFALRLGQTVFSSASLLFMSMGVQFYSYTSFWTRDHIIAQLPGDDHGFGSAMEFHVGTS